MSDMNINNPPETVKTLADRLKFARECRAWSQPHLGVVAGVSTSTVGMIETGARENKGSLPKLAVALGVRHLWLLQGDLPVVEPLPAHYAELAKEGPIVGMTATPKGTVRVAKWNRAGPADELENNLDVEAERLHQALDILLSLIPPGERKVAALEEALQVVGARLRPAPTDRQDLPEPR
jgi:transcriptional regulator with XRE-family HTH domain